MKVVTAEDMQTGPGPEDWFTGTVWRDAAPVGAPPDVAVNRVLLEPGARLQDREHRRFQARDLLQEAPRLGAVRDVALEADAVTQEEDCLPMPVAGHLRRVAHHLLEGG